MGKGGVIMELLGYGERWCDRAVNVWVFSLLCEAVLEERCELYS